jgi:type IV pilus assembly protein PilB
MHLKLGEYLVEAGLVFEDDVARALAEQSGLRYVVIDPRGVDRALSEVMPEVVAMRLGAVPLHRNHERVVVAVADPTDVFASDEVQMLIDRRAELVVAERSAVEAAIRALYAPKAAWAEAGADVDPGADAEGKGATETRASQAIDADTAENAPAVDAVNSILRRALEAGASDVHWIPRRDDLLVRIRVDGVMRDLDVLPIALRAAVVARLKVMAQLNIAERRLPQDGRVAITLDDVPIDLRMAVLPSTHGEEVVLRIAYVGRSFRRLEDVELAEPARSVFTQALHQPGGAIIVAAPTGSGKTTTLYAALAELNDGRRTIISIEDPVEADVEGVIQIEVNAKIGLTFAAGLRTILRADPDVIFVGEIRDRETAEIALEAAMTGHLVLSTVHAETAAAGIVRLRQLGVEAVTIGSTVRCMVSQRLLRRPCPHCTGERLPARRSAKPNVPGCRKCAHTGYAGRVAAFQALRITDSLAHVLEAPAREIEHVALADGMQTMRQAAQSLVQLGLTTEDELLRVCGDREA